MRYHAALLLTGLLLTGWLVADEPPRELDKAARAAAQAELARLNGLIGEWRGVGQVRRGSTQGAWQETSVFAWKFTPGSVGIEYRVKGGTHLEAGLIEWDAGRRRFTMQADLPGGARTRLSGELKEDTLTLESDPGASPADSDPVLRITIRRLNEQRVLVLYEQRKPSQTLFARLGEVGCTREGTRLAVSGQSGPECVVTGGAGTIRVSHKGETWFVCCSGCREAFDADPDGVLAEYRAKKKPAAPAK